MKILKLPEVIDKCGLSRSSIYAYVAKRKFPAPINLGDKAVGWIEEELDSFLKEKAESREGVRP